MPKTLMEKPTEDNTLLAELRQKQTRHKAFNRLYNMYQKPVKALAYNIVRDVEDARDICQEVFGDFWRLRLYENRDIPSLFHYLMTMCRLRSQHMVKDRQKQAILREIAKKQSKGSEAAKEPGRDLHYYLVRLPKQQRKVVDLVVLQDCTYAQAAEILGLSRETTRKYLKIAIENLLKNLPR